jgi:hypothetical protein
MLHQHPEDIDDLAVDLGAFAQLAVLGAKRGKITEGDALLSLGHEITSDADARDGRFKAITTTAL